MDVVWFLAFCWGAEDWARLSRSGSEGYKVIRAYGGCPGISERRRTQRAAKSHGDLRARVDPWISEWGNPPGVRSRNHALNT